LHTGDGEETVEKPDLGTPGVREGIVDALREQLMH
jgi:hypothetical protein